MTFRSKFEQAVAVNLANNGIDFCYEQESINFVQPEKQRKYTPDFWLSNGVILEAKGVLTKEDREKHLWIKEQFPDLDIRFVFQNPNNKITKDSPTRYRDWADKHGFKWCKGGSIPRSWLGKIERPTRTNNR